MTYRATLSSAFGLYAAVGLLVILLTAGAVLSRPPVPTLLIPAGALVATVALVRFRYRVRVLDDELQARSLFTERHVRWRDIVQVGLAADRSFWASRFYGPSVFEFVTHDSRVCVNFKLFPVRCLNEVMRHVPSSAKLSATLSN